MTTLQADRLLALAKKVRTAQKQYFRERSQPNLIASKQAEAELDKHIAECEQTATANSIEGVMSL